MEIRKQIFRGTILLFPNVPEMVKMCNTFHHFLIGESTTDKTNSIEICKKFEGANDISMLWKQIIHRCGLHRNGGSAVMWDRVRLRIQSPANEPDDVTSTAQSSGRFSCTLPVHRDTWASNVQQQINWWAPLLPLSENATLAIYPSYFNKPVPNSSSRWSFDELKVRRSQNMPYPQLPVLEIKSMSLDEQEDLRCDQVAVVINPGDVLVFSGAHLHGSVANGKAVSNRYSTEVRTVDTRDVNSLLGAPNVDGAAVGQQMQWFSSVFKRDDPLLLQQDIEAESCLFL